MPDADFEEKEYEIPLYLELADGSPYVWSPGQVLEKSLGLDGMQHTMNSTFWKLVSRGLSIPTGIDLNSVRFHPNIKRQLPTFRCNLMLQVKRPQYMKNRVGGYSGQSPYYRFTTETHQQRTLASLAMSVGNRAFIGYASPAFYTLTELYRHIVYSNLVSQSTFISALQLIGHHHWAYSMPGTSGQALSKPEFVTGKPFVDQLERLAYEDIEWKSQNDAESNIDSVTTTLHELAQQIRRVCMEESKSENPFAGDALYWMNDMESSRNKETHPAIRNFAAIQIFCSVFDVVWFVVG